MASQTLTSVADVWPAGTTVGAYVRPASTAWDRASTPPTAAVTTAVVTSSGSLAFTGLVDDTAYVAYASGRARDFRTVPAATGGGGGAPSGSAGGDLGGTYPNPTVPGLAGKQATLAGTGDVPGLTAALAAKAAQTAVDVNTASIRQLALSRYIRAMADYTALGTSPVFTAGGTLTGTTALISACLTTTVNGATTASTTLVLTTAIATNGQVIYGTGITQGTTVVSGGGTTTLVLSAAATVANGATVAVLNTDVPWRYEGADVVPFITGGVAYAVTRNPYNGTGSPVRVADPKFPVHLDFDFDGQAFMVESLRTATATGRVWINEQVSADWSIASGSTTLKVDASATLAAHTSRRWVFEIDTQIFFKGITYVVTDTLSAPESRATPTFAIVGDSFSVGGGIVATQYNHQSYAHKLARRLGFANYRMYGQSGTGLLNANAGVGTYRTRISDVTTYQPDFVFIQGSINDGGQTAAAIQTELETYIDALRAGLPSTSKLAVCGPNPVQTPSANEITVNTGMKAACATRSVSFLDFITNTTSRLGTGTGRVGATTGDGNADFYHAAAAVTSTGHPTQGGHDLRERQFAARLAPAWSLSL